MTGSVCPACGAARARALYSVDAVPVQSCILLGTAEEARAFPRADIALLFCDACGFIWNEAFRPGLVDYAAATEESQHFSGTFNSFAARLIEEIAAGRDLRGKHTLEIGCGKGDFLHAFAERTGSIALGVDPGFVPDRAAANGKTITFRAEYFRPEAIGMVPDFVVCRHTLEHIAAVSDFLSDIETVIGARPGVELFFETPDAGRVLSEGAFWDIYYEHCSYFTCGSHARLFERHGMDVTASYLDFGGQYIIQYARTAPSAAPSPRAEDLAGLRALADRFPERVARARDFWSSFVRDRHQAGKRVGLWGGGSKAVSFITSIGLEDEVTAVVDINPHKQGRFLPGSAHRVEPPERLADSPPDTVIVMNPVYVDEIRGTLAAMGVAPEVVCLS